MAILNAERIENKMVTYPGDTLSFEPPRVDVGDAVLCPGDPDLPGWFKVLPGIFEIDVNVDSDVDPDVGLDTVTTVDPNVITTGLLDIVSEGGHEVV